MAYRSRAAPYFLSSMCFTRYVAYRSSCKRQAKDQSPAAMHTPPPSTRLHTQELRYIGPVHQCAREQTNPRVSGLHCSSTVLCRLPLTAAAAPHGPGSGPARRPAATAQPHGHASRPGAGGPAWAGRPARAPHPGCPGSTGPPPPRGPLSSRGWRAPPLAPGGGVRTRVRCWVRVRVRVRVRVKGER